MSKIWDWLTGGDDATHHIVIKQGRGGRWRYEVVNKESGKVECLSPVRGWETREEAERAARQMLVAEMDEEIGYAGATFRPNLPPRRPR